MASSFSKINTILLPKQKNLYIWAFFFKVFKLLISVFITLIGLITITFFIGRLLPLDPVIAILGDNISQESYDKMFYKLGLDQPLIIQYWTYLQHIFLFDFGDALVSGRPILTDIMHVFPPTLELATVAIIIGTSFGIPFGVIAAMYRNSAIDYFLRFFTLFIYSTPTFWLGLIALLVFYNKLDWIGGPGRIDFIYEYSFEAKTGFFLLDTAMQGKWEAFGNAFSHIIMPALILAFGAMAYISRMTRGFMIEQLNQEYIVTARVKGLSWRQTVWRHAFRNAAVQIITIVGLSYAFLLEGAVLTETVFAWPGFGRYLTNALLAGDMNAVVACTLLIGCFFIVINLFSDLLYRIFDPRTR
ncbi:MULTISPECIES: ABC transporter permease [unclassified Bartonella]|uniref:ABC transporter permease n=1 Tax=unclassified Bartonella TaxID=2645622 RepID=UPI00099A7CC2|nr:MULTISPECIES: ABC transporter permease [unclassified Bartonella]AQX27567.1 peptide/nickel transport system permease protein [Bartonella sp. JB15]AQX28847.1 peptide/nickel transport system permease protein [Bartonella sp. JB63]